jgi:hypothetical protein
MADARSADSGPAFLLSLSARGCLGGASPPQLTLFPLGHFASFCAASGLRPGDGVPQARP